MSPVTLAAHEAGRRSAPWHRGCNERRHAPRCASRGIAALSATSPLRKPSSAKRTHREILTEEIAQGLTELGRPSLGLLLSAVEAATR